MNEQTQSQVNAGHDSRALTARAHAIAVARMENTYKNTLSASHSGALQRTAEQLSMTALGETSGRVVIDLPTGAGKTLSVVAWLTAAHQLGCPVSVIVAASQVEALAKIIRALRAEGVPADKIGLIHDKEHSEAKAAEFERTGDYSVLGGRFASLPSTSDNDQRPFLFVSHQRIRAATSLEKQGELTTFKGRERDLLIWDEVMMTTAPSAVTTTLLASALGTVRPFVEVDGADTVLSLAFKYVETCFSLIQSELKRQQDNAAAKEVQLPPLTELEFDTFGQALTRATGEGTLQAAAFMSLLTSAGQPLRVALMGDRKSALVWYRVSVPPTLKNVVVLDAAHAVNRLVALDPTIQRAPWFEERAKTGAALKTYENVTVSFLQGRSGRSAMEEAFSKKPPAGAGALADEIVQAIARIPSNEAVIVFTFKPRSRTRTDIPSELRRRLKAAGVDPDAKLEDGRPRITVLTWGYHTSLNEYAHAENVVFAGVLQLPDEQLLAWAVGQRGDLLVPLEGLGTLDEIKRGEVAGVLYQAMSRGRCRFTADGKALPMKVWLVHHDPKVRGEIEKVMPGVRWCAWEPVCLSTAAASKAETIALRIAGYLRGFRGDRVSNRAVKAALGLADVSASTFKRAVAQVELEGWSRDGSSFVKVGMQMGLGFGEVG